MAAISPIGPKIESQPLNDNFAALNAEINSHFAGTVTGVFNVKTGFGALGDGTTDDLADIQAAIDACASAGGGIVYFPTATYSVSDAIIITHSDIHLVGNGSTLLNTSTNKDTIQVGGSISRWSVSDFILDRSVVATAGAGIKQVASQSSGRIDNVLSKKNYYGFQLSHTDSSVISRCTALLNVSHGFYLIPAGADGALQWNFHGTCLAADNGGDGMRMQAVAPCTVIACGTIDRFDSFNNTGRGIAIVGIPTCPIHGFRLMNAFLGSDHDSCLYLDTYGMYHTIGDVFAELSLNGHGIHITANNTRSTMSNVIVTGHGKNGIYLQGSYFIINSVVAHNNGILVGANTDRIGVFLFGNKNVCNSAIATNSTGNTTQFIGLYVFGANCMVTSGFAENNSGAQYSLADPNTSFVSNFIVPSFVTRKSGSITATPNGSGIIAIPHGLAATPTIVSLTVQSTTFVNYSISSMDATNINVKLFDAAGVIITTGSYTFFYNSSF